MNNILITIQRYNLYFVPPNLFSLFFKKSFQPYDFDFISPILSHCHGEILVGNILILAKQNDDWRPRNFPWRIFYREFWAKRKGI